MARVLAYCLEFTEGIAFSRGLSDADDPPIAVRDLTGAMQAWIDVGTPSVERLHRASKASPRVVVYIHKEHAQWLASLEGAKIHRAGELQLRVLNRALIRDLAGALERRMSFALSVAESELFVSLGHRTMSGRVERVSALPS